ncbi:MAG: stage II sporulation protein P [Bacilli bacterium]|nr:stage II sporulation protein P [Bacilli bacterium]
MKKFKTKKKHKKLYLYIFIIVSLFFIFNFISNIKLTHSNEEFIRYMLNDSNYYKKYEHKNYLKYITKYLLNIDMEKPKKILESVFNYKESNNKIESLNYVMNEKDPIIYIYNTHDTEEYNSNYLYDYDITPNVKMASFLLEGLLKKEGINTIVEENSMKEYLNNNNLAYSESYQASRYYLEEKLKKYPNLKLIIDLHRDSIPKDRSTISINGINYAKTLFVVGENNEHFKDNYNLSNTLNDIIKNKYPNISRGVLTKTGTGIRGRFNQDLSSNIVLIECGGSDNTIDEVMNTMVALKDMIKSYLGDSNG